MKSELSDASSNCGLLTHAMETVRHRIWLRAQYSTTFLITWKISFLIAVCTCVCVCGVCVCVCIMCVCVLCVRIVCVCVLCVRACVRWWME